MADPGRLRATLPTDRTIPRERPFVSLLNVPPVNRVPVENKQPIASHMTLKNDLLRETLPGQDENECVPLPEVRSENRRVPILGDYIHGRDENDGIQEQQDKSSEGLVHRT